MNRNKAKKESSIDRIRFIIPYSLAALGQDRLRLGIKKNEFFLFSARLALSCLAPWLEAQEHLCQVGVVVEVVDELFALI